jgi:hypothetical protein
VHGTGIEAIRMVTSSIRFLVSFFPARAVKIAYPVRIPVSIVSVSVCAVGMTCFRCDRNHIML